MANNNQKASSFLFTSFQGGIGKTFVAYETAKAIAKKTGKQVALFEFNILKPSTIVEMLPSTERIKTSFLEYYMSNWMLSNAESIAKIFTEYDGIYYIPFSGNNDSASLLPSFRLSEEDLTEALTHLLELLRKNQIFAVFDIAFQMTPLPLYLVHKADAVMYIYNSQPPAPAFAQKFQREAKSPLEVTSKLLWIRNHVDKEIGLKEASLFDNEHIIPMNEELMGGNRRSINQSFEMLADKLLAFEALGKTPQRGYPQTQQQVLNEELIAYRTKLRSEIVGELESKFGMSDAELREIVEKRIEVALHKNPLPENLAKNAAIEVKQYLMDEILGLGPLEDFMRDEDVDEIMVNGPDKIFVEKYGKLQLTVNKFTSSDHVKTVIERILMPAGRTINERTPYVDARLLDGSRVHAIIPPLSLTGPMITIRKFSKVPLTIDDLVYRFKSMTPSVADFLKLCVKMKKNIVVSGGASSGKTTLLNVLSTFISPTERIICIEDSAELNLSQLNLGRLEARQQGTEAKNQVTIRDLVKNALRMRPDRIIVGECRGAETLDMLQAMNTGHDGSLTTLHANSPKDAIARLETMVLMAGVDLPLRAIREQIASSVNIIVQNGRLADGKRKLLEVIEVVGMEDNVVQTQTIFEFRKKWIAESGDVVGKIYPTGVIPTFLEKMPYEFTKQYMHLFDPDTVSEDFTIVSAPSSQSELSQEPLETPSEETLEDDNISEDNSETEGFEEDGGESSHNLDNKASKKNKRRRKN